MTLCLMLMVVRSLPAESITLEGAPADTGYNVGSVAVVRATLKGVSGDPKRYALFAEIQYVGMTALTNVQMDLLKDSKAGELNYEVGWPIPGDAPTGLYSVLLRVEDRTEHKLIATQKVPGFAAYKKLVRISRFTLDKTFYVPGETIQCAVPVENLSDPIMKDLRVEFSNANYPWISTFSGEASLSGQKEQNPELDLRVLTDRLTLPPRREVAIPQMSAGKARFLQGTQVAVMGAGGPARHYTVPPPETDTYTIAVWNKERTVLFDMQFSPQVIVRDPAQTLPKPYSRNYTHPYNQDIDFKKYREFYAPGQISSEIRLDQGHTLYRPGDRVVVKARLAKVGRPKEQVATLDFSITDPAGKQVYSFSWADFPTSNQGDVGLKAWTVPVSAPPGTYSEALSTRDIRGNTLAQATTEIAVNKLPASVLVFCPHEDDEHPYAGLIRAAVEAGIPIRVMFFTGGDVGECERYFDHPCGPNEAREFGMVRMEESTEALEHIGLTRDKVTFLGLPDGGSGAIWSEHQRIENPFMSVYLASDHAPYENIFRPNLAYARDAVIDAVKQIIVDFHPALIATPHPDERHTDHRTANWFVVKACQELLKENRVDANTVILADQAYGAGGFKPAPYKYEKWPVYLSGEVAALKQEMSWIYQSQDGNLAEGTKKTLAELPREEVHYRIVDWGEHAGWNE
jgi:LmbE family N-acetylglucosaminyl deacetylase